MKMKHITSVSKHGYHVLPCCAVSVGSWYSAAVEFVGSCLSRPSASACLSAPCTPGLSLLCDTSSPKLTCGPCRPPVPCLSVCLTPLLPVWIVGKHCRRNQKSLSSSFFKLPTHWLTMGSCGHLHQWQSWLTLHLTYVVFFLFVLVLFLMFKWPLVGKRSHCTVLESGRRCIFGSVGNKETIIHPLTADY